MTEEVKDAYNRARIAFNSHWKEHGAPPSELALPSEQFRLMVEALKDAEQRGMTVRNGDAWVWKNGCVIKEAAAA